MVFGSMKNGFIRKSSSCNLIFYTCLSLSFSPTEYYVMKDFLCFFILFKPCGSEESNIGIGDMPDNM